MSGRKITRRTFLATSAFASAALAGCGDQSGGGGGAAGGKKGRVIILGFDGVEPSIIQEMIDRGELPNYAAVQQSGSFRPLRSTIPPQSPVAWTSFSTCRNPGAHNIYDFIRRNKSFSSGPMPELGTGKLEHPRFSPDGTVISEPEAQGYRKGTPFWMVADDAGIRCKILNIPYAFPPDDMQHGIQLCGLGVQDLRGTDNTYFSLSDAFAPNELEASLSGGKRLPLEFDGSDIAQIDVPGPRNLMYKYGDPRAYTATTWTIRVDRKSGQGKASWNGHEVELKQGAWSEWVAVEFPMSGKYTAFGITRFFPLEIGEHVRLYMSCQQYHPSHPYVPISHPNEYSATLQERYGLYKTIGWAYDTHALRQDDLFEEQFLMDVRAGMAWREQLTLDEIDRGEFDMLISCWTATDRVGHMFWRFRDPQHPMHDPEMAAQYEKALEETYTISDRIIGKVLERLQEDDLLMVLSDHGFATWRRGFHVNTWLEQNGYLKVARPDLAAGGFLQGFDWKNTQAYSVGLSSLYLNIAGRERVGVVPPAQADALMAEIRDRMMEVKDPQNGAKVFSNIYPRSVYSGEAVGEAPDLSLGYAYAYQSSKRSVSGALGEGLCEDNMDKWSGEHSAADVAELPGIFFCNKPVEEMEPSIVDLGMTALAYLGVDAPSEYEGQALM